MDDVRSAGRQDGKKGHGRGLYIVFYLYIPGQRQCRKKQNTGRDDCLFKYCSKLIVINDVTEQKNAKRILEQALPDRYDVTGFFPFYFNYHLSRAFFPSICFYRIVSACFHSAFSAVRPGHSILISAAHILFLRFFPGQTL